MKTNIFAAVLLSLIVLVGCSKTDTDLKDTITIYDLENPGLPIYSEFGYNTFGAYYGRETFTSNDYDLPGQILVQDGNTTFTFTGRMNGKVSLNFQMLDMEFNSYESLVSLNGKKFDLSDSSKCTVSIDLDNDTLTVSDVSGFLIFNKVQYLLVDKVREETILSGEFELQAIIDGKPYKFTNGRFDIGIGNHNFYQF